MSLGSFNPSHGPGLFTTRAVLSGSAANMSINSATVIAPSPGITPALHFWPAAAQRFLPTPARELCKAAHGTGQAPINQNGVHLAGLWTPVKSAGWDRPWTARPVVGASAEAGSSALPHRVEITTIPCQYLPNEMPRTKCSACCSWRSASRAFQTDFRQLASPGWR